MRVLIAIAITAAAAGVLLASQAPAMAQWTSDKTVVHGMFGPRQLGDTFKPKPGTRFSGTFLRGPGGIFVGRDPVYPGATFAREYYPNYIYVPPPIDQPQVIAVMPNRTLATAELEERSEPAPVLPLEPALAPEPTVAPAVAPDRPPQPEPAPAAPQMWFRGERPSGASGASVAVPGAAVAGAQAAPAARRRPAVRLGGVLPSVEEAVEGPPGSGTQALASMRQGTNGAGSVDQVLSGSLQSQISQIRQFNNARSVRVSVTGGIATLQGTVSTPHARRVLAEFVRMEPGVWKVNSELTVQP